jgi:hypothetical protein
MLAWILANKEWLFSGIGLAALGAAWWLARIGYRRWAERPSPTGHPVAGLGGSAPTRQEVKRTGLLSRLPPFVLRIFLRPEVVSSRVDIDLRGENPIRLVLNAEVPYVDLYFQITNLSPLNLVLDRLLADVWFGQPTFTSAVLRRYEIPAGQITRGVQLRYQLASAQRKQIDEFAQSQGQRGAIHIYLTGYFQSRAGSIEIQKAIDRQKLS